MAWLIKKVIKLELNEPFPQLLGLGLQLLGLGLILARLLLVLDDHLQELFDLLLGVAHLSVVLLCDGP